MAYCNYSSPSSDVPKKMQPDGLHPEGTRTGGRGGATGSCHRQLPWSFDVTFSASCCIGGLLQLFEPIFWRTKKDAARWAASFLVRQKGLEPPTFWFVAKHSIQLSYWRIALSALNYSSTGYGKKQAFFQKKEKIFPRTVRGVGLLRKEGGGFCESRQNPAFFSKKTAYNTKKRLQNGF